MEADATRRGEATDQIRVFLLDDHEVVRRGVRDLLETHEDITVVGEAGSAEEARNRIAICKPHVAVLDGRTRQKARSRALERAAEREQFLGVRHGASRPE